VIKLKSKFNVRYAPKFIAKIVVGEKESFLSRNIKTLGFLVKNAITNTLNYFLTR
jgi:hypothetical protein